MPPRWRRSRCAPASRSRSWSCRVACSLPTTHGVSWIRFGSAERFDLPPRLLALSRGVRIFVLDDAPVAHSDRALGFEPRGSRFDSCRARFNRRDASIFAMAPGSKNRSVPRRIKMTVASIAALRRWEQKELAQSLRRQGLSYREILARLPFSLSRSTIGAWCKEIELTPEQLDRLDQLFRDGSYRGRLLGPKATQARRATEVEKIRARARAEVPQLIHNELWLAGLMLYWAEGSKVHGVGLSNSDPILVKVMMTWFRIVCRVPEHKFRAYLNIHSGQDDQAIKAF